MLDLSLYNQALPFIQGGDVVVFEGARQLGNPLTWLNVAIDVISRSYLTHAAIIYPQRLTIEGQPQKCLHIIEDTIWNGVDGVQINPLAARLEGNTGVAVLRLSRATRLSLDWHRLWARAIARVGRDKYNIGELFAYVARDLPLVKDIPQLYQPTPGAEVCSEFVCDAFADGGMQELHPAVTPPQKLAQLGIYDGAPLVVYGKLSPIRGYNATPIYA